jgi:hypothetical protein
MSFGDELLDLWGAAMWRASWQGGLAALVVAFICRIMPSMPARFQSWMWRLAILKFVIAFAWSAPVEVPILPRAESIVAADVGEPIPFGGPPGETTSALDEPARSDFPLLLIPFAAWAAIAAWQIVRICVSCRNARLLRSRCHGSENRQLLDSCSRWSRMLGLSRPPLVLETEGQGSPLLVGILRPAIVLPTTTLERLEDAERSLVLGHELAHLSRRDLFWSLVAAINRALFFFHPVAWFGERRLGLAQEIAADQLAISLQSHNPIHYARLLLAIVGKLGPRRATFTLSMGAAGEHGSLYRRLSAMRYFRQTTARTALIYGLLLGHGAALGLVPWRPVAAPAAAESEAIDNQRAPAEAIVVTAGDDADDSIELDNRRETPPKPERLLVPPADEKAAPQGSAKSGVVRGRFVSAKQGTLTVQTNSGELIERKYFRSLKTAVWSDAAEKYVPTDAVAALKQAEVGISIYIDGNDRTGSLRIGSRKVVTSGTFVSYENDRLLMLGTNLGEVYTKKYGNSVRFNKFRADVPAFKSIDGAEYRAVGSANDALRDLKQGTILHVHSEGDDNVTLVRIGETKK